MNIEALEPFVDAATAAKALGIPKACVIARARRGTIPGYPRKLGSRNVWRFLLSELPAVRVIGPAAENLFTSEAR